jgi:acyl-CoA reductase-like NAD-dependent aldehyde dehydrogenase
VLSKIGGETGHEFIQPLHWRSFCADGPACRNQKPIDKEVVGLMPLASTAQLDEAVAAAREAFKSWSKTDDAERQRACHAIADLIQANSEDIAQLLTREQGKPLNGLGSRFEMGGAYAWTRATADLVLPVEVLQDSPDGRVELHRKPIGVVGSITPWNWPVMIACWHIIPAVRAGNTVVIKPSPLTPLSTIRLGRADQPGLATGRRQCSHRR